MIVNSIQCTIGTQNNTEITNENNAAINLLQQIYTAVSADQTLSHATKVEAQTAISSTARDLSVKKPSKDSLIKSLAALTGIGSVANLLSKLLDLF